MNLNKKKILAAKTLKVGKNRIILNQNSLAEIKEAITKQDIKDLAQQGIIKIKSKKGRKKIQRRKTKRGGGKIKKKIQRRKQEYVKVTRKLRDYAKYLKESGKINKKEYLEIRKKIKAREFKSKTALKEFLGGQKWKYRRGGEENIKQIIKQE